MNKLIEILYDTIKDGEEFEKKLTINSKDIIEVCGGNWLHLKESTYWMREDDVLENNDKVELRILKDPVWKNMILDYPGRRVPIEMNKNGRIERVYTTLIPDNNEKNRYVKLKNSLINEGWRTDVGEEFNKRVEIYMLITNFNDEYVIDFMMFNGNHRTAIIDMYDLELDVPITLRARFYKNIKNYDLPKNDEINFNNMMRKPLFLKFKTKKTKPVTL